MDLWQHYPRLHLWFLQNLESVSLDKCLLPVVMVMGGQAGRFICILVKMRRQDREKKECGYISFQFLGGLERGQMRGAIYGL